jgi:exosortase A
VSSAPASLSVASADRDSRRSWRIGGAVVIVLAAVFLLYWPSANSLMQLWSDTGRTTYTHGFIIAAIAAYLVWRKREQFVSVPWAPSVAASLLVLLLGLAWLIAVQGVIELIHQLLMLALLWTSVWAIFGLRIAAQLWIPVGYLIFAIPAWDQIIFLLQEATVRAVALMLQVSSIPAFVDGNFVHLAAGVFEVAGGCSGIHFFIVALALATLYGEIGRDSMKVRIQLVFLGGGLALLANWLRVYIIVVAGHLTNMQHPLVREGHYNFGWMVFAVMMLIFFLLARRFVPAVHEDSASPAQAVGPRFTPGLGALGIAVLCVVAAPVWQFLCTPRPATLSLQDELPRAPAGWQLSRGFSSAWNPNYAGADREERVEYTNAAGLHVQLYAASYALQRPGKELVSYGNAPIGAEDGRIVSESATATPAIERELEVQGADGNAIVRYYFDVGGRRTGHGIVAQLWYGIASLRREPLSSVVALRANCVPDCDTARALLAEMAASLDAQRENPR